jgi:uncharacterized membrane protein
VAKGGRGFISNLDWFSIIFGCELVVSFWPAGLAKALTEDVVFVFVFVFGQSK